MHYATPQSTVLLYAAGCMVVVLDLVNGEQKTFCVTEGDKGKNCNGIGALAVIFRTEYLANCVDASLKKLFCCWRKRHFSYYRYL